MTDGYEVGSSVTVRALHQMPVEGPEGELHAHDYRFDVVVGRRAWTSEGWSVTWTPSGPPCRGSRTGSTGGTWREIRPPEAEAVTVEVLARWAHQELVPALRQAGGDTLAVRVWETDADFGGYAGPVA